MHSRSAVLAAYFNSLADQWDSMCHHDPTILDELLRRIGVRPGDAVLDVGCGTGVLTPHLRRLAGPSGTVTGVDLAEQMIAVARRKHGDQASFIVGDVMDLPPAAAFDVVVCYSAFPHFGNQPGAIEHMSRLLKRGGRLAVCQSQSRRAINERHASADAAVKSDLLPPASEVAAWMARAELTVSEQEDSDRLYLVVGIK